MLGSLFRKYAVCGALAALCLTGQRAAAQTNLIVNPGFEDGLKGWHEFVPSTTPKETCKWEVSTDKPHSGANSLRLISQKPERFGMSTGMLKVQGGERYKVSAWVRVAPGFQLAAGNPGILLRVDFPSKDNTFGPKNVLVTLGGKVAPVAEFARIVGNTVFPAEWTLISAVFEVPQGAADMCLELFMWSGVGESFWDDVELVKVDAATPLSTLPAAQ